MKRVKVSIATTHGRAEVNGELVAPGLAVVPYRVKGLFSPFTIRKVPGMWSITHIPSGKSIGHPRWRKTEVVAAAKRLAALGNWDRPAEKFGDLGFGEVAVLAALGEVKIESDQEDDGDA